MPGSSSVMANEGMHRSSSALQPDGDPRPAEEGRFRYVRYTGTGSGVLLPGIKENDNYCKKRLKNPTESDHVRKLHGLIKKRDTAAYQESRYWQNQWKQQRLARLAVPRFDPPQSFWNDKKRLEDHFIQNLDGWRKDAEERIAVMGIRDAIRVLGIGAGQEPFAFRSPPMAAMSWLSNRGRGDA